MGFDAGLLDSAAELRARIWGDPVELNRDYLVWKYLRNPYLTDPLVHFALVGSEVVGMRASMGTCWESGDARYVLPHGGDVMVDARLRGQGILRRLQEAYVVDLPRRGFRMAFSLSGGRQGTPAMVAGGWHVVVVLDEQECRTGRMPSVVRDLSERGHRLARRITKAPIRNPLSTLAGDGEAAVRVLEPEAFRQLAEIAERGPASNRLRHVRDEEYFRWRLANPLHCYRALASREAYVILQWAGAPHVNLVDWRAPDTRSLASVLHVAFRQVHAVRVWNIAVDSELRGVLERLGSLRPARTAATFTLRTVSDDPRDAYAGPLNLNEASSWELRMLDSDAY